MSSYARQLANLIRGGSDVQAGSIGTSEIADSAITAGKIATNAVTNAKVADDAIGVNELAATGTASASTYLRGDNTWASVDALPSQTGHADQYLKSDGTSADWADVAGGATGAGGDKIFVENGQTVTTNYSIPSSSNAMTSGPVTVNSGVTVTVPTGSVWHIL